MNYLIMRERQYKVLIEGIHQGEGYLILMPLAVYRIETDIL